MYESHWQLRQKPFENACDPQFYFPGASCQAALLKLRYTVENRRGAAVLAGPAGCGKTMIVAMLRRALGSQFAPLVHVVFPQMAPEELLAYLADEMCGPAETGVVRGVHHAVRRIQRFLAENARRGDHAVLVIDEAHLVDPGCFEAFRLLMNFEAAGQTALTLVLCGQTALLPQLARASALDERTAGKALVRPFTEAETAAYVAHRLQTAGASRDVFDPDALAALHTLTHGVARRINRLGDLALLVGYAEQQSSITASALEAIDEELLSVTVD
jgi:general secretion pathway protein A